MTCFMRSPASFANASASASHTGTRRSVGLARERNEDVATVAARSFSRSNTARARSRSTAASAIRLRLKLATPALAIAHAAGPSSPSCLPPLADVPEPGPGPRRVGEHPGPGDGVISFQRHRRVGRIVRDEGQGLEGCVLVAGLLLEFGQFEQCRRPAGTKHHGPLEHPGGVGVAQLPDQLVPHVGQGVGGVLSDRCIVGQVLGRPIEMAGPVLRPLHQCGGPTVKFAPDVARQRLVRHLSQQRIGGLVPPYRAHAQQPALDQRQQGGIAPSGAEPGDLAGGDPITQDGRVLEDQLWGRTDGVQAGRQQRLQRGRDRGGGVEAVAVAVIDQATRRRAPSAPVRAGTEGFRRPARPGSLPPPAQAASHRRRLRRG